MKNLKINSILVLCTGILLGLLLGYFIFKSSKVETPVVPILPAQVQESITSMNSKLDTLQAENAALLKKNDSIQVRVVKIKENHEETSRIILANDVQSDYLFFSDYIGNYDAAYGFMYIDIDTTAEDSESDFQ